MLFLDGYWLMELLKITNLIIEKANLSFGYQSVFCPRIVKLYF